MIAQRKSIAEALLSWLRSGTSTTPRRRTSPVYLKISMAKLDEIVRRIKTKKDIGVKYMKSWERERELIEAGKEEGREEERRNTERERQRANGAEKRIKELEAMLAAKS